MRQNSCIRNIFRINYFINAIFSSTLGGIPLKTKVFVGVSAISTRSDLKESTAVSSAAAPEHVVIDNV